MSTFNDALFEAAKKGYEDDVVELIKSKMDLNIIDNLKNTPLHYAAGTGHAGCVKLLAESGRTKLDLQNTLGETALHKAAVGTSERHAEACRSLVGARASLDVRNKEKKTPLQICLNSARDFLAPSADVEGFDPDAIASNNSEESSD